MKTRNALMIAAAGTVLGFAALPAHAELIPTDVSCTAGSVNDGSYTYADCAGAFEGNTTNQQEDILGLVTDYFGVDADAITYAGSSDGPGFGPFTGNPEVTSGTLEFDSPIDGSFVLGLKAANAFSLYYFTDADSLTSLAFNTLGVAVNQNDMAQDLSHADLWFVDVGDGNGGTPDVPEPATLGLLGLGLLGAGAARRRAKR